MGWLVWLVVFACVVGILLSTKYPFFKWCFALQQMHHTHAYFFVPMVFCFQQNIVVYTAMHACLFVACGLIDWLVVFCFSAKYPFFKWCFACTCLLVCCLWYFAFQQNILSLNGALLYGKNIIRIFLSSNGVLLFSKASLYIFTLSGVLFSAFTLSACYSLLVFTLINFAHR